MNGTILAAFLIAVGLITSGRSVQAMGLLSIASYHLISLLPEERDPDFWSKPKYTALQSSIIFLGLGWCYWIIIGLFKVWNSL